MASRFTCCLQASWQRDGDGGGDGDDYGDDYGDGDNNDDDGDAGADHARRRDIPNRGAGGSASKCHSMLPRSGSCDRSQPCTRVRRPEK